MTSNFPPSLPSLYTKFKKIKKYQGNAENISPNFAAFTYLPVLILASMHKRKPIYCQGNIILTHQENNHNTENTD